MNSGKKYWFLLSLLVLGFWVQAQKKEPLLNIIFILSDDLGYGDVGCYGQQKINTPNIDRMATEGLRFTQFYAGSTVCAPSRASFLSGLHTGHTAVRGNVTLPPEGQFPLPSSTITFPMLLQKKGYRTGAFGKWSLGYPTSTGGPGKKGFDTFFGYNCQTLAHDYYPDHLWRNLARVELPENIGKQQTYSADLIHSEALKFLRSENKQPFFLYLPYTLPHAELSVPHDSVYNYYVQKFGEAPKEKPAKIKEGSSFEPYPHAAFAAMVSRLDKYVGEILSVVEEKNLSRNTLVIFTSDNGPHMEGGGDPVFFNSNGPFKGIKRDLYEGGVRVPFIAWQKGVIKPGTSEQIGAFWDLFPTFLQLANVPNKEKVDGISLANVIYKNQTVKHPYLYWELHESGGKQAVRFEDWKGVKLNVSSEDLPLELYNLKEDPKEEKNIAAQHPEIVKKINALMKEAHVANKDWPLFPAEQVKNKSSF